jgi:hypothetical protein
VLTPSQLSIKPNIKQIVVPEYDFDNQIRWHTPVMAGRYTYNSIQTFDNKGQPRDAQSDNND